MAAARQERGAAIAGKEAPKPRRKKTIPFNFGEEHKEYIRDCRYNTFNVLEGAVRSGKTIDNVFAFAQELKTTPDRLHLATGSTMANAKLNIGDANGFGLEFIFRGQCKWAKYKGNDCLLICGPDTGYRKRVVIFCGGAKADSYKKFRGNSFGIWIATEINLHHDNTIREAFNRQLAAKRRKIFWDLNPEHPNAPIYENYIDLYARREAAGELLGGYNYRHFSIFQNANISRSRLDEIVSQYEPGSIWYNRDILGQRCIAEGLIYPKAAAEFSLPKGQKKPHSMSVEEAKAMTFIKIVCTVDFGGNGSGHAFVAQGITVGYENVVALKSRRYVEGQPDPDNPAVKIENVDPDMLGALWVKFLKEVVQSYGYVTRCMADSAEQVLIRGLRTAMNKNGLGNISMGNALKSAINDRIFGFVSLFNSGRYYYVESECKSLMEAIGSAVWNPNSPTKNERLDNGTSDIDSMDAMEYGFERDLRRLIQKV